MSQFKNLKHCFLGFALLTGLNAMATESANKLSKENLLEGARAYQRIPVTKNGQPVLNPSTGAIKTQSRVLRGYMRQNCRDLHDNELADLGATNWKGLPLELCRYKVIDTIDKKMRSKEGTVVLLKITDEMLANWTTNTCMDIGSPTLRCVEIISDQVIRQSRGQFAISGIVYEDQYILNSNPDEKDKMGEDGIYEPYCMREGITVFTEAFNDRSIEPLTEDQVKACMQGPLTKEAKKVGRLARIQGTSVEMYVKNGGKHTGVIIVVDKQTLPSEEWLVASRDEMQEAVRTGNNSMMTLWAKQNLSKFPR